MHTAPPSRRAHLVVPYLFAALVLTLAPVAASAQAPPSTTPQNSSGARERKPQTRPHGQRVKVDPSKVTIDDGDTAVIQWADGDKEIVRFLGIDTPETRHPQHDLPYSQSFGEEARAFGQGAFAAASQIELIRANTIDPYGRSLGYFFLNGKNYSALVVSARLAAESVSHYGDNGLPEPAAEVLAASKAAGPLPFEPPHEFRRRMRDVTKWMKEKGVAVEQ
jgi:micrococcal nuclease